MTKPENTWRSPMLPRSSAKTRRRKLERSLSVRRTKSDLWGITVLPAGAQLMTNQMYAAYGLRNTFGILTPNSMPSPMRRVWVRPLMVALSLSLILLVWTAHEQSSKRESSRWLLCGQLPSLQTGGLSMSEGLKPSFPSAELDITKFQPRSKKHEAVQSRRP